MLLGSTDSADLHLRATSRFRRPHCVSDVLLTTSSETLKRGILECDVGIKRLSWVTAAKAAFRSLTASQLRHVSATSAIGSVPPLDAPRLLCVGSSRLRNTPGRTGQPSRESTYPSALVIRSDYPNFCCFRLLPVGSRIECLL